ncbi:hypothetical protein PA7_22000 [Pseudonocardia asaccharolytica DSM 44247 = NBRC 16224]|uniref:Uncharacterized protein n=1 Tax=Pseudonocardia asaccharolytica DSM 44247 = NBRC 16224 TaxID=1123024 RepID=A0A511D1F8_9PSEU|nr:hypothetical protein PA7_22000 [Pseudonocardia asaccharolytica DSM 44247 = NBRC 16224]
MQGAVELAVAGAVEPVPDRFAAAGRDGCDPGEGGEGGFVAQPAGVGPGHQELGGGDGTDAGQLEQAGTGRGDELFEFGFVFGGLGFEHQRAAGHGADRADGGAVLDAVAGQGAQPGAAVKLLVGGAAAQLLAQGLGGVDDQRFELPDGPGAGHYGALASGQQHPHGFAVSAGSWRGQVLACEGLPGSADGIELVGLGAIAPRRPVDLHDPLATFEQKCGQPGAEAAGALDCPDPPAVAVLVDEGEQPLVAQRVGGAVGVGEDGGGGGVDERGGVGVAVGVDADDDLDLSCQHGHAVPSGRGR